MCDGVLIQVIASNIDTGQVDFELKEHKKIKQKTVESASKRGTIQNTGNKKNQSAGRAKTRKIHKKQRHKHLKNKRKKYIY